MQVQSTEFQNPLCDQQRKLFLPEDGANKGQECKSLVWYFLQKSINNSDILQSHKAVSRRKCSDFGKWHSKWLKSNVSDSSQTSIQDWFMGKCEGLVANKTHKVTKADLDHTPYRTFYKYKAEIIKTSSSNGPASANDASANATTAATSGQTNSEAE